jgi:ribonuclease J
MGLLPPLRGLYRTDLEDAEVWERAQRFPTYRECHADAVLLSHAHIDHCGYLSFLDLRTPVIATAMTAYLCKAIQDCGAYQFEGEMCYAVPKAPDERGAIGSARHKDAPFIRRPYCVPDTIPDDPEGFWNLSPGSSRGRLFPEHRLKLDRTIGALHARYFPVDHSIYGAAAIAVETSAGWIVYTGDLRNHGHAGRLTEAFVEEAARLAPVALLCEGTNIERPVAATEEQVFDACLEVVKEASGRLVVADFGPRNIERLLAFLEIARRTDRRLVVMDKDAYLLAAMRAVDPAIPTPQTEPLLRVYRRILRSPRAWVEHVRAWYPDQVGAADVHADPGAYILCLSFFDITELVDIDPASGIWIYSSSEPHNEEQQIDLWRLRNWLEYFHLAPIGFGGEASQFHVSGHIGGPALVDVIRRIAPARVIPVHTTAPRVFEEQLRTDLTVTIPVVGTPIHL